MNDVKNTFKAVLATIAVWVMAFIPLYFYILARFFLSPDGFVQEATVFGFGLYFLGFIQFCCILFGLFITLLMWEKSAWR